MCTELAAAPQALQVLHVSEQEEDVLALGMSLEQPAGARSQEIKQQKKTAAGERPEMGGWKASHSRINHRGGREALIERLSSCRRPAGEASPLRPLVSDLVTETNRPVAMESSQPPAPAKQLLFPIKIVPLVGCVEREAPGRRAGELRSVESC